MESLLNKEMDDMEPIYLNDEWFFTKEYSKALLQTDYPEENLEQVRLPHTCKELPLHYFDESEYQMVCGYRRHLWVPKEWEEKILLLTIDGACHSAHLYVNGEPVGEHHCGYTAFTSDITSHIRFGEDNLITISVDSNEKQNIPPFGFVVDYMTYGGLTRDVYLEVKEKTYLEDVFIKTLLSDITDMGASGAISSRIRIAGSMSRESLVVRQYLYDGDRLITSYEAKADADEIQLTGTEVEIETWDITQPKLYRVETKLLAGEKELDSKKTKVGFRKAEFKADGFYLNEKKVKIRGLNRHQSYPYVGYAMPESMQKYDADILKKELGCNAVRTSHYPQSHYFVERCDEIGLLVFMEFPGWQHIGDEAWQKQAIQNEIEMITQYRNHPSIILWGVRINESQDMEGFYKKTNAIAHELDDSRPTGGVRAHKKSQLLEDVYTYNDFVHDGQKPGCEPKKKVTPDMSKPYLISEYNGHMYPTKAFDWEEHRVQHALRHARVLDAVAGYEDIAGSFGWCMFDYNTHKDFGSGDRICYHGVMDMFRNPKLAALIYACQQEEEPVLELSSTMDIGEHPGCNRGDTYIFSNADAVRMYKNDVFIKEYVPSDSGYKNLKHGPILIDDFIGDEIKKNEPTFSKKQADIIKYGLNYTAIHGYGKYPLKVILGLLWCMVFRHMKMNDSVALYNKYIGDWGGTSTVYKFEAIKNGAVVKTIVKEPMKNMHLEVKTSSDALVEKNSYDVIELRIRALDEHDNQLYFFQEPLQVLVEGEAEVIGPSIVSFKGGMTGAYIRSTGRTGKVKVTLKNPQIDDVVLHFTASGENRR